MNTKKNLPLIVTWLAMLSAGIAVAACGRPVLAAGYPSPVPASPTPLPSATTEPTPAPTSAPTPLPSATPVPRPVCTIEWVWRENGLVITAVDPSRADGLVPGDLILAINGRSVEEVILEAENNLGGIGDPALRRSAALDSILFSNPVMVLRVRHRQEPAYYYNLHPGCRP